MRLALDTGGVPAGPAIEPARHPPPEFDLSVPQRQEQVGHPVFGRGQGGERGERHAGAQIQQHRVHRLTAEVLGQLVAHGDVADRLAVADPQ